MAEWKVSAEIIEIFSHDNADSLELAKVGQYQLVVQKGLYKTGDTIIFFPEKSIIPDNLISEFQHLRNGNRVGSIRLRGELSMGATLPVEKVNIQNLEIGKDISEVLGVVKYEPKLPQSMGANRIKPSKTLPVGLTKHDVEQFSIYKNQFDLDEDVIVTEKIHGCVTSDTKVLMFDGSYKRISSIMVGDVVYGYNNNEKLVFSKVLATKIESNTLNKKWIKLKVQGNGFGNSTRTLKCTEDHLIYCANQDKYIEAAKLIPNRDKVVLVSNTVSELSFIQEQIVLGKILGDGSVFDNRLTYGHSNQNYTEFTSKALGWLSPLISDERLSGHNSLMYRDKTVSHNYFSKLRNDFYLSGKKEIPSEYVDKITPLALAFWYMDDGSLSHHNSQEDRANFATNGFSEESIDNLVSIFNKYGILVTKYNSDGWRIRLNKNEAEKFFVLISPYIPECMQYKLPERFKGKQNFIPKTEFSPITTEQNIISIEYNNSISSKLYDLETETNNFVAHGIVIHNSQIQICQTMDGERLVSSKGVFARGFFIEEEESSVYWQAYYNSEMNKILDILSVMQPNSAIQIIGEVVPIHKGFSYGFDKPHVLIFDIRVNGESMSDAYPYFTKYWVPVLHIGKFSSVNLQEICKGNESVSGYQYHIKEGVVVRPMPDRRAKDGTRLMVKIINPAYAKKETGDEVS